ncbi:hypothetical protein ACFSHQ_17970 [Gemmobacter lanyuensis]
MIDHGLIWVQEGREATFPVKAARAAALSGVPSAIKGQQTTEPRYNPAAARRVDQPEASLLHLDLRNLHQEVSQRLFGSI